MTNEDMQRLVTTLTNKFGSSWRDIVDWMQAQHSVDDLERAILTSNYQGVLDTIDAGAQSFAADVHNGYVTAGQRGAKWLDSQVTNPVRFVATNEPAASWARQNAYDKIVGITQEQRDLIRQVVSDGAQAALNPRQVATQLRDSIGLTDDQAAQVNLYRQRLTSGSTSDLRIAMGYQLADGRYGRSVQSAIDNGVPIPASRVDAMVDAYRSNYVDYRAENIAHTEGLRAAHEGVADAFQQAITRGDLEADVLVQEWNDTGDDRERDSHRIGGQQRKIGEKFTLRSGVDIAYPGDQDAPADEVINCRCAVSTKYVGRPAAIAISEPAPAAQPEVQDAAQTPAPERVTQADLSERRDEYTASLTTGEMSAMMSYTGEGYGPVNNLLRGIYDPDAPVVDRAVTQTTIDLLDSALAKAASPDPLLTYRGIAADYTAMGDLRVGDVFLDRGFASTTTVKPTGPGSLAWSDYTLEITSPTGTKIAPVPSQWEGESEMLLARGTSFRVDEIEDIADDRGTRRIIRVTVAGQSETAAASAPSAPESGRTLNDVDLRRRRADLDELLDPTERKALAAYTGVGNAETQNFLRGVPLEGDADEVDALRERLQGRVESLDSVLSYAVTPDSIVTYRGVGQSARLNSLTVGDVFVDKAYASTTTDIDIARQFAGGTGGTIIEIASPAGTKIGAVPSQSLHEKEMLLGRGTAFRVDSIEDAPDPNDPSLLRRIIHVTVVGQT